MKIKFDIIEDARIEKNISIQEICDKLDINKSTYSRWKNYKVDPPATKFLILCNMLEISIEKII